MVLRGVPLHSRVVKKEEPGFCFFLKFIYFWLRCVFFAVRGLFLVAASRGYLSLWRTGFSLQWLLLLWSTGSRCTGFSSCSMQASVVVAHGLLSTGSVVMSSQPLSHQGSPRQDSCWYNHLTFLPLSFLLIEGLLCARNCAGIQ